MKIHCVRLLLVLLIIAPLTSHCTPPPPDEFDEISLEQIKSTSLSSDKINGSLSELNRIPDGTILVYKTNEGRYGKLQIRDYGYNLTLRWKTYNSDGSVHSSGSSLVIRGTYLCDLDLGEEIDLKEESGVPSDFRWAQDTPEERYLITMNGAEFGIFKSVSLTTIAFDKKNMSDTLIPIVFDTEKGFDVRVSSGAGAGQILFPETVKDLSEIEDIYFDVPDVVIREWYTFFAMVHLYLHDLNLDDVSYEWSADKGGSLKLAFTFEEEGKEILGAWHGDIWDALLVIYFIPYVDMYSNLHWEVEVALSFEEEVYGVPESWFWDKDDTIADVEKILKYTLSNLADEVLFQSLRLIKCLPSNEEAKYYHVSVVNGSATFYYLDRPRTMSNLVVKFDHIEVHDEDYASLTFIGDVNGNSTEWSDWFSVNSGDIYLTGGQWERNASVAWGGQPLNIQFEGYAEVYPSGGGVVKVALGEVDLSFSEIPWDILLEPELQSQESKNGDYTLHYWIVTPKPPPGYKRLLVFFDRIWVHSDEDSSGSGELFFRGEVNGHSTGWSGQYDRDSGSFIYLGGQGRWQKTVYVRENQRLFIDFEGYDDDATTTESLGELTVHYSKQNDWGVGNESWGVGCHQKGSSNGDFTLYYRVVDPDAEPPEEMQMLRFLVTFMKAEVHDDEDPAGSGELFFYGAVNCDYTTLSTQMDLNSGDTAYLHGGNWFKRVEIPAHQAGYVHIFFTGYDADETTIEDLGFVERSFGAVDNWGLDGNGIHTVESTNGDFTLTFKVEKLE